MHSESSADFSHCEALDLWQGLAQQRSEPFRVVGTHRVADRDVQWPLSVRAPRQGARKLAHVVAPAKHTSGRCDFAIRCCADEWRDMHEAGRRLHPCWHSAAAYCVTQVTKHAVDLRLRDEFVNCGNGLFHGQACMRTFRSKHDQQSLTQ